VDARHLVGHVAQQIAALHAVIDAAEDGRDHVATVVAVRGGEGAQVGKQAGAAAPIGADCLILVDEGEQLVPGDPLLVLRPVAPAVRRIDGCPELLPRKRGLLLALGLQVVEEFEEHNPRQKRQPVEIAVEPLVLAHDVACRFEQAAERLRGRRRRCVLLGCG
jgi:hypothetical protein